MLIGLLLRSSRGVGCTICATRYSTNAITITCNVRYARLKFIPILCGMPYSNSCKYGTGNITVRNGRSQSCIYNGRSFISWKNENAQRYSTGNAQSLNKSNNRTTITYVVALAIAVIGLSYAAVPLYRVFCQASGYGGTVSHVKDPDKIAAMEAVNERPLTIRFNADTGATMRWQFKPKQKEIQLVPGETALAFYTAKNPTDEPIVGISTYNVIPFEAGLYFNKVQCFCFEEQRLNPHEEVDMPVFFYIDPEIMEDPALARVDVITLSYTFFESKDFDQNSLPTS